MQPHRPFKTSGVFLPKEPLDSLLAAARRFRFLLTASYAHSVITQGETLLQLQRSSIWLRLSPRMRLVYTVTQFLPVTATRAIADRPDSLDQMQRRLSEMARLPGPEPEGILPKVHSIGIS